MSLKASLADLRRFYGIDAECAAILRRNRDFLSREFTAALDLFYRTAPAILGISSYINDPASVAFAREKYLRHWETMMQARFADDYADSVASIYRLRNDFGINLQLSMGGRSFILARVLEAIALRLPRKPWDFSARQRRAKLQLAYLRVTMLDLLITMDGYLEAGQDERTRTLSHLAKSFEHAVGDIVAGVTAAAGDLRSTSDVLTLSAEETTKQ
ncbi:MAG TPA: protoglobin domain-containing protein, partial [Methylovirgula sp.]